MLAYTCICGGCSSYPCAASVRGATVTAVTANLLLTFAEVMLHSLPDSCISRGSTGRKELWLVLVLVSVGKGITVLFGLTYLNFLRSLISQGLVVDGCSPSVDLRVSVSRLNGPLTQRRGKVLTAIVPHIYF
jgi:hypothetical protein